jgi:molybdate-binding protein
VAGRLADVGFGVQAAAQQFGLGFVPVATERYFLICRQETLEHPAVRDLLALLRSDAFNEVLATLPGYAADRPGEVTTILDALPWPEVREQY